MAVDLTNEEQKFVKTYIRDMNAAEAYRKAFPEKCEEPDGKRESELGNKFLKVPRIAEAIERYSQPSEELAVENLRQALLTGKVDSNTIKAAEHILKYKDKNSVKNATERWAYVLCNIGAKVIVPEAELQKRM